MVLSRFFFNISKQPSSWQFGHHHHHRSLLTTTTLISSSSQKPHLLINPNTTTINNNPNTTNYNYNYNYLFPRNPKPPHLSSSSSSRFNYYSTKAGNNGNDANDSGNSSTSISTTDLWKMSDDDNNDITSVFSSINDDNDKYPPPSSANFRREDYNIQGGKWDYNNHNDTQHSFDGLDDELLIDGGGGLLSGLRDRIHHDNKNNIAEEENNNNKELELEEKSLLAVIQGPDRTFGDLIASSGITDEMLDSLIALKDFEGIQGLPPLSEIEKIRYEKNTGKSIRDEIERLKQEEVAKARVQQIDHKGRAYGTGRRKCSIARVWIQPGEGKFVVNDKQFDSYFPMLDHRAALLRPFSETKTMGLWDVSCTVKGGGTSGQVGAIRLGISRALQNWEPGLRPPLKEAGFLTRDSRVVERKKPGRAKARKSFQWVKR